MFNISFVCRDFTIVICCLTGWLLHASPAWTQDRNTSFEIIADMPPAMEADVVQFEPDAQIIEPLDYVRNGNRLSVRPTAAISGDVAWARIRDFWIEPITPPANRKMPEINPVEMRLYEVYGSVSIKPPRENTTVMEAKNGMVLENGATISTRTNASVAVLIGGINSVRFAPESEGSVRFIVRPRQRMTTVQLERGIAFSKVGTLQGVQQDYSVRTKFGVAEAKSTDFVTVLTTARMDVWIAHGEVALTSPDGKEIDRVARADYGGKGPESGLAFMRTPKIVKPLEVMNANSQSITSAVKLIPSLNAKLNDILQRAKTSQLDPVERDYLKRIPPLIYLRKVRRIKR